jgi:hypothetical protein
MRQLPSDAPKHMLTSHAMLVPWGIFAQRIGLVESLEGVPIPQRPRDHTPQTKLIEFLVAILSGGAYLQDISHGPHPLDQDRAVAQAWGQPTWADDSGVSRTLKACDEQTVSAVRGALRYVSRPFIEREVMLALGKQGTLIFDGDLTGRPVSNASATYPDVAFGWMSDAIHLGYQAALVSMHSPTYGRLWLSVEHHPGDTVSSSEAEALARAAEAGTGARPWRRTDLLAGRIATQEALVTQAEATRDGACSRLASCQQRLAQVEAQCQGWAGQVTELERAYQARHRPERPHSQLAQARRKLEVQRRRLGRRQKELENAEQWLAGRQQQATLLQAEGQCLAQRLAQFEEDNRTNPWPIPAVFRLDGGFGTGPNVALLIEMGYTVYSKAANHQTVGTLCQRAAAVASWTRVGRNAEMIAWDRATLARCPYPLDLALERFHTGEEVKHGVLLHYGAEPVAQDLRRWFSFYNGRQTIEAGIKEGKGVFQMHHLKVRSPGGLVIQEEFATFAANFVRWAAVWLDESCPDALVPAPQPQTQVKELVRVAANTSAWVMWQPDGCLLRFTELSAFAGAKLAIRDSIPLQLALPLFTWTDTRRSRVFTPI